MTDGIVADLALEPVRAALGDRPLHCYPAALSSEVDALAWVRDGAPDGAVVVAAYQASPRGRAGLEWPVQPGRGLVFSMVQRRSQLKPGRLYVAAACALADVLGDDARIQWPDTLLVDGRAVAAVGVQSDMPALHRWTVLTVGFHEAEPPRAALLARAVEAVERRLEQGAAQVGAHYRRRCSTIGERVEVALALPGPDGNRMTGTAQAVRPNGELVLVTDDERRAIVPIDTIRTVRVVEEASRRVAGALPHFERSAPNREPRR